jgi:NosR/NirI family nitrous oxide reductase transcriptional regulator
LKQPTAVLVAFFSAGVALAAARIYTNPNPTDHLKKLFPSAAAFSPLAGEPLHFNVYGADPKKNPSAPVIGYAFWTTDLVPREGGYHGPIHLLVGMDLSGVITGVELDYHSEPYGYFSVEPPEFVAQFKNKSIREAFKVGADIHAVSRASLTINSATRAIRDSSRMMARQFLTPEAVK